jgi:hypothetical protein
MQTIGVISDTHVPDKAKSLHPRALEIFRQAQVSAILHAGDISTPGVLARLGEIAPVHAVKGNRDWLALGHLPRTRLLTFEGVRVALAHGHGGLRRYLYLRLRFAIQRYPLEKILALLQSDFAAARPDVLVYGHTHYPLNQRDGELLIFNPGAACCADLDEGLFPAVGLLHLDQGQVQGEIIALE